MDPTVVTALITVAGTILGYIIKGAVDGWHEARKGRKDEAQTIAEERDRLRRERDSERHRAHRWADRFWQVRQIAIQHGIPAAELPQPPSEN